MKAHKFEGLKFHILSQFKAAARIFKVGFKILTYGIRTESELKQYLKLTGGIRVLNGPFQGLAYLEFSHCSMWPPKVLGTYEREIQEAIAALDLNLYRRVVDIGCAEGYYLAGLAYLARKQNLALTVEGYDLNAEAIEAANWLCRINNLNANAYCKEFILDEAPDDYTLFFIDIEGDEFDLLSLKNVQRLLTCSFIVEVHEPEFSSQKLDSLIDFFKSTHNLKVFRRSDRTVSDFPTVGLPVCNSERIALMNEYRKFGNTWLYASTKHLKKD